MANLSIRKLDDKVYQGIRLRAAQHGVSMEEEVRQILKESLTPPKKIGDLALEMFGREHGAQLEPFPRKPHEPIDLSKCL